MPDPFLFKGRGVSRPARVGYGFTVKLNICFANLPVDMVTGKAGLGIGIFGETMSAIAVQDVLYEPAGKALKK